MRALQLKWIPAVAVVLAAAGCLRRIEVIEIAPDGGVKLAAHLEGDQDDVRTGSAMPSAAGGWSVEQKEEKDGDKVKLLLTARQAFAPGAALPDTYADPASPNAKLDLHFSTSVRLEKRPEGTYYHFTRRYRPRVWAQFDYYQEKLVKSGEVRALAEKDPKELTDEERGKLAENLIQVEALRTMEFLAAAGEPLRDALPQDVVLKAQMTVQPLFADPAILAETVELLRGEKNDDALARLDERLMRNVHDTIARVLKEAQVKEGAAQAFMQAYDAVLTDYKLSEDLGDEVWAVAVRMPGRIIAHNCVEKDSLPADAPSGDTPDRGGQAAEGDFLMSVVDSTDFPRGADRVGWSFEGTALYDREVVLMATSFVPAEKK